MWELDIIRIDDKVFDGMLNSTKNILDHKHDRDIMELFLKDRGILNQSDKILDIILTGKSRIMVYFKRFKNNA